MGLRSSVIWLFRTSFRFIWYGFLITLPVTFFPLLTGIEAGITFYIWNQAQVWSSIDSLLFEIDSRQGMDYFNVPGALTIREFQDQSAPFFIPSITSEDWAQKLGITKPLEHSDIETAKIDVLGTLDGIMRYPFGECADAATQMWVYVTDWAMPEYMPWDTALDQVLQEMHTAPFPANTSIHYLHCGASSFLCIVWKVKGPSLVLFTVDEAQSSPSSEPNDVDSQPGYTYPVPETDLLPFSLRVIELPLKNTTWLLPQTTFPTEYAQLSTLLFLDLGTIKSHFEPYSAETQLEHRFEDHRFDLRNRVYPHRTVQWWMNKAMDLYYDYLLDPLLEAFGFEDVFFEYITVPVFNLAFEATLPMAWLVHIPFQWLWEIYAWYMGLSVLGTPIEGHSAADSGADKGGNFMDDMMGDFMAMVLQNISDQQVKDKMNAAMTSFVRNEAMEP